MSNQLEWKRVRYGDPFNRQGWHYVAGTYRIEPLIDRRWFLFGRMLATYGTLSGRSEQLRRQHKPITRRAANEA